MNTILKPINDNDLETIMNWRNSPEVSSYMYSSPNLTLDDQKKWFENINNDDSRIDWVINFEGEKVGVATISAINKQHQRCDWAYYLASPNVRGKGIGKAIELSIHHYVFEKLKLNKLCCEVFSSNEKVISIHERFGSKIEGKRINHIYKDGKFLDIVEMAIIKEDWEENIKNKFEYNSVTFE